MSCELCEQEIRYNGYENYPTWCLVNSLINNKEDSDYWTELAKVYLRTTPYIQGMTRDTLVASRISHAMAKAWIEPRPLQNEVSIYSDFLQYTLQQVNWGEVAEVFIQRTKEEEIAD